MKCANCNKDAQYIYKLTLDNVIYYCAKDLPSFLEPRRKAGLLELTQVHKDNIADGMKAFVNPAPEVEEEPAIEEATKPKPVKKASKKKAE